MTACLVLFCFTLFLIGCLFAGFPLLIALSGGFLLFFLYGLSRGLSFRYLLSLAFQGLQTVKTVAVTMALVGILTALWRLDGTIAFIVYHLTAFLHPSIILTMTFWLCTCISVLTGTSFGATATMGIICMTITNSMNINPIYAGGAILSGVYVGDRCSPVSTSALLVAAITETNIFDNISGMIRTSVIPFAASSVLYTVLGFLLRPGAMHAETQSLLAGYFTLSWLTIIPAALVIILSLCRFKVQTIMGASIVTAAFIAAGIQHIPAETIVLTAAAGFQPTEPDLSVIMSGGGIVSMLDVIAIICISATYAGLFSGTGLLHPLQQLLRLISKKSTPFGAMCVTSLLTSMLSCNQTLAIMLTHQLCAPLVPKKETMAIYLENSAVIITPLVPWAIACSVVLAILDAPETAIFFACYLYLIPVWNYIMSVHSLKKHLS